MRVSILAARKAQLLLREGHEPAPVGEADEIDPRPETLCFRGQTLALVRHFFELSCQVGRLPSLLGREFFRAPRFPSQHSQLRGTDRIRARC